jgi:hypothetical protein
MKKNPNRSAFEQDFKIYYNMDRTSASVRLRKKLANIQLEGNKFNDIRYQQSSVEFNSVQQKMYREVIYGVENIKPSERAQMTEIELGLVAERFQKGQRVINQFKNEVMAQFCDKIFKVFYNSPIAKEMLEFSADPDNSQEENTLTFKDLGIKKHHVAIRLVEHGILPVNFFQLSA